MNPVDNTGVEIRVGDWLKAFDRDDIFLKVVAIDEVRAKVKVDFYFLTPDGILNRTHLPPLDMGWLSFDYLRSPFCNFVKVHSRLEDLGIKMIR